VFAVVQHQQHAPGPQGIGERGEQRLIGRFAQAQRRGDRGGHEGPIHQRGQLHQPDTVGVARTDGVGGLQGQARLATAADAG